MSFSSMRDTRTPDGIRRTEDNDCVIRAISFATDLPYWEVKQTINRIAPQQIGRGYYDSQIEACLRALGVVFEKVSLANRQWTERKDAWYGTRTQVRNMGPTIARFMRENPTDRWLFGVNGHLIGIREGVPNHKASRYRGLNAYLLCSVKGKTL